MLFSTYDQKRQTGPREAVLHSVSRIALAAILGAVASPGTAHADASLLPGGGVVQTGSATIMETSDSSLTIDQTSSKAIIDWSSFSVGSGGVVQFNNGSGATLNRVTGDLGSAIDGMLSGTGSVYLINPNGVIVGKDGVVNVGGSFVASTHDLMNSQFLAGGDLTFAGPFSAAVVNYGKIGALGGDVALIAARVDNQGQINASRGAVGLLAGYQVVLRDKALDNGKFSVLVGGAGTSATNAGTIRAAEAELRANGGNVYALAGNTDSIIKATGVSSNDGKVYLVAEGGNLTAHGVIEASNPDGSGGFVETSGATVDFAGVTVRAGNWLIDPYDLTIDAAAATTISTNLATTSVTLKTTVSSASGPGVVNPSGSGDITIAAPISWSSANALTLDAFRDINVNSNISATGASAGLLLRADNTGTGTGTVTFGGGSTASLSGAGSTIRIYYNPAVFGTATDFSPSVSAGTVTAYQLVNELAQLQAINSNSMTNKYALGRDIDASATASWNAGAGFVPVGTDGTGTVLNGTGFTGSFDGQGHVISNLTIDRPSANYVGVFGYVTGDIRNIGSVGGSVRGLMYVGGLVGFNRGTVTNAYTTGTAAGSANAYWVGGLVGDNAGTIAHAYATGAISGNGNDYSTGLGGLVGNNEGTITDAYATGAVNGYTVAGGLVGYNTGIITDTHASGIVATTAGGPNAGYNVGGLVGINYGTITNAYATGTVSGFLSVGGLVGVNAGTTTHAYATGAVSGYQGVGGLVGYNFTNGPATITDAYATGAVNGGGGYVGGLVGYNEGTITDAYATGAVNGGHFGRFFGGLVGLNVQGASIIRAYATGTVTVLTGSSFVGGLVGANDGSITEAYASGAVTGAVDSDYVGGLVGVNGIYVPVTPSITHAYATGAVTGHDAVGGLAGGNNGTIARTYSTGTVAGAVGFTYVGGLVGLQSLAGTLVGSSYWDTQTSGQSIGVGSNGGIGTATGLSTAQMQNQASYATSGWDFVNVWSPASAGYYPQLYGVSHVLRIAANNQTKVYGDATPTLTSSLYGLQGGDTASVVTGGALSTSTTNATWVGNYSINVGSASATGASGTYRFIYQNGLLSITPRPLVATLKSNVVRVYDSTTVAALGFNNYLLSGVLFLDAVQLNNPTTGTFDTKNVGTLKIVSVNGLALTGAAAGNYTVNTSASAAIGKITPATITVSLTGTVRKVYDGTNSATLSLANYSRIGILPGDIVVLFNPLTGTYQNAKVGTGKKVSVAGISITGGADGGNYVVNSAASANIGTITAGP